MCLSDKCHALLGFEFVALVCYQLNRDVQIMIAPLAKLIDCSALQRAYVVAPLRYAPESKRRLAEALEFLNGPDFIPAASDPARIEFEGPRHFRFPRGAHAKSRRTTPCMAGSIGAPRAGRSDR
jgi:hypothetical protein